MSKRALFLMFIVISLCSLNTHQLQASIYEDHPNPTISFIEYVPVSTTETHTGRIEKEIKIKLSNISTEPIFDLNITIRLAPAVVEVLKGDLSFGDMAPGETKVSDTIVHYSFDPNEAQHQGIPIIWSLEYKDADGKTWKNESIVVEEIDN